MRIASARDLQTAKRSVEMKLDQAAFYERCFGQTGDKGDCSIAKGYRTRAAKLAKQIEEYEAAH